MIAQLIIKGKKYGTHPFLLQVRSLKDHTPLLGITIGDIGPKMGMNSVDNGYLKLDRVRIPRTNMFMKWNQVDADGNYTKPSHAKLSYLGMISIRAGIVGNASNVLSKNVTIAIRYSLARRQFDKGNCGTELQILDYPIQQYRLFGQLSRVFALKFTGTSMTNMYTKLVENLEHADASALPEVHASSSGLKSLTTWIAADGSEECRRACGGHGFLISSGLAPKVLDYVGLLTAEGENYLLTQQTARYLLKSYGNLQNGQKPVGNAAYIGKKIDNTKSRKESDFLSESRLLELFQGRANWLIETTAARMLKSAGNGQPENVIWDENLVEFARISNAHCYVILLSNFIQTVHDLEHSAVSTILKHLCLFFALWTIEEQPGEFLASKMIHPDHFEIIRNHVRDLSQTIRPDALALVDSFDWTDFALNSTLGSYDGNVYERIWKSAQQGPLNQQKVADAYKHIETLIKSNL